MNRDEAQSASGGDQKTVLLVEDEPLLREMDIMVLSGLGFRVLPAENGVEALRLVEENSGQKIHLLVTDVLMPEMGGLELAERLRAGSPQTKVIFCSGCAEDTILPQGGSAGISFMQKPYSITTLTDKVREALEMAA
jgi:CheY-like chemotaxis protein